MKKYINFLNNDNQWLPMVACTSRDVNCNPDDYCDYDDVCRYDEILCDGIQCPDNVYYA